MAAGFYFHKPSEQNVFIAFRFHDRGPAKLNFEVVNIHSKSLTVTHLDRLLVFSDNTD